MEKTFQTAGILPSMDGKRFGVVTLGYDRVQQVRDELSVLLALASVVCGVPADQLNPSAVQAVTGRLQALIANGSLVEQLEKAQSGT